MRLTEQQHADFLTALGEEFARATAPPIPDDASIRDCCEPVWAVLGTDLSPTTFATLEPGKLNDLAASFAAYFETAPPSATQLADAIEGLLLRWPPDQS